MRNWTTVSKKIAKPVTKSVNAYKKFKKNYNLSKNKAYTTKTNIATDLSFSNRLGAKAGYNKRLKDEKRADLLNIKKDNKLSFQKEKANYKLKNKNEKLKRKAENQSVFSTVKNAYHRKKSVSILNPEKIHGQLSTYKSRLLRDAKADGAILPDGTHKPWNKMSKREQMWVRTDINRKVEQQYQKYEDKKIELFKAKQQNKGKTTRALGISSIAASAATAISDSQNEALKSLEDDS